MSFDQGGANLEAPRPPSSVHRELLEREGELGAVEGLISTRPGGRLLAIEGPPGIGKTALVAEARSRALEAGMRVLGARGSELERSFSYGVVRQLFESLLASAHTEELAGALSGAAALAAPLFAPVLAAAEPAADASLATLHGLYWLTANLAASQPLLLAVDDLHWCDLPSLRWLAYLLPRMEELPVLISDPIKRAEIALLLGRQLFVLRREDASDAVLAAALTELAGADAELGRLLDAGRINNGLFAPELYPAALEGLDRVRNQPANATFGQKLLLHCSRVTMRARARPPVSRPHSRAAPLPRER